MSNPYGISANSQHSTGPQVTYQFTKFNHSIVRKDDPQAISEVYNVRRNKSMTPKPLPIKQQVAKDRARPDNRVIKHMVDLFKKQEAKQNQTDMSPRGSTKVKASRTEEQRQYRLANVVQCYEPKQPQQKIKKTNKKLDPL